MTSVSLHSFHIPVMGIGHSIDTPLKVAPMGISSVISLVDDFLLEKLRQYYCSQYQFDYEEIPRDAEDGRAQRITAYLNMVQRIVTDKFESLRQLSFFENNEKRRYFDLLPDASSLKKAYVQLMAMAPGTERDNAAYVLSQKMQPGSIDVNIMVKLDRARYDRKGTALPDQFSDAKAALRGYANSVLRSSIIFSAGLNPRLFSYLATFSDFYRDATGQMKKKIIVKVSDFRSALIQSKFLAKHGLEVSEFRVESGLNCGGHAFPSQGQTIPIILAEFRERWSELTEGLWPQIKAAYQKRTSQNFVGEPVKPMLTVQGGIGTVGETERLQADFGVDRTGWGSPFLLVPEATNIDDASRELLRKATEKDLYLSDVSPLGIPFNNIRRTSSEQWTTTRVQVGRPGSKCPSGFAVTNTEFTERPICVSSRQYQALKLAQISDMAISDQEKEKMKEAVFEKTCICVHLGNGILVKLGLLKEEEAPQAVCPGPNIAWFDRFYSLDEMVNHIYGRGVSLVPAHRPHMFVTELKMNVDYLEKLINKSAHPHDDKSLREFRDNIFKGILYCRHLALQSAYSDENLASMGSLVREQEDRLGELSRRIEPELSVSVN